MRDVRLICLLCNTVWTVFSKGGWLRCPECGNSDMLDHVDRMRSLIQVGRYAPKEIKKFKKRRRPHEKV